jgi:regulator of protease activity HflC (stomatin/prohibitin superfamily)
VQQVVSTSDKIPTKLREASERLIASVGASSALVGVMSMTMSLLRPKQAVLLAVTDKQRKEQREARKMQERRKLKGEKMERLKKKEQKVAKQLKKALRQSSDT